MSLSRLAKIQHDTNIKVFQIIISLCGETLGAHLRQKSYAFNTLQSTKTSRSMDYILAFKEFDKPKVSLDKFPITLLISFI